MAPAPTTWVLTDGRAGNERQALALARALSDATPRIWRLQARAPWKLVAPRRLPGSERAFGDVFADALREPPTLAIGCGRQAALATRLLRKAGASVVQILNPRIDPRHWDAVVLPEHDRLRGANVVTMIGSLHDVDAVWLAQARTSYPQFGALHSPRTLLLLGGPIGGVPLDAAWWRRTADTLRAQHRRDGGSLSICASPRTPAWLATAAENDLSDLHGACWFTSNDGPNPYAGLLAWAERIVVSPDSVNMISEAVATSAQVSIASPELARGRHALFLQSLIKRGRVQALDVDSADA
ncbi:MAG TPA: mitochondrial fission ELM1 family protein, partial [Xanthomonadaceae bacterium]|nr:mitochondrial fission ELM1 family protein [Xanthomonadaceae bacterium]